MRLTSFKPNLCIFSGLNSSNVFSFNKPRYNDEPFLILQRDIESSHLHIYSSCKN